MADYSIYVCLECRQQSRGPGGHRVGGDDVCSNMAAHPKDVLQPRLARISVAVADEGTRQHLSRVTRRGEDVSQKHYAKVRGEEVEPRA